MAQAYDVFCLALSFLHKSEKYNKKKKVTQQVLGMDSKNSEIHVMSSQFPFYTSMFFLEDDCKYRYFQGSESIQVLLQFQVQNTFLNICKLQLTELYTQKSMICSPQCSTEPQRHSLGSRSKQTVEREVKTQYSFRLSLKQRLARNQNMLALVLHHALLEIGPTLLRYSTAIKRVFPWFLNVLCNTN